MGAIKLQLLNNLGLTHWVDMLRALPATYLPQA